jgi:hypothetical protein
MYVEVAKSINWLTNPVHKHRELQFVASLLLGKKTEVSFE